ncbi:MAG TPA: carboxypeptidase regulatory-like domain-containing protein [Vicinamibacterales bacterium]|nr:carboxypeptidase regulatory-like domain-containing protein [Vicinamibacterales bacterium]
MRVRPLIAAILASTLFAAPVWAQRTTATVRGTVTDQSKAFVPGATVTLTGQDTGLTRTTTTNASGVYTFTTVPVGRYTVSVELQGFKTATQTDIVLNVADDRAVDFELAPGAVTESVSVQAESTPVKTVGGDVSGVINGQQVRELPLNGRNFLQLATLMPGVSAPDFLNVKDKGLLGGSDLSVSGGSVTANMWTVDGANNNDVGSNRTILVYPSVDAIEEFKILRNAYGAEFGQAGGAQINIVTRGGTNAFHGSGFYFGRNDALDAKNYFLEKADQPKQDLRRNDFGWTLGGPIMKDRLHFFASQEWNVEDRGTTRHAFVPTAAERSGDFSGPRLEGCTPAIPIDPLTGSPFPGNQIPADRLSAAGQAYLNLYPLPNTTPVAGSCDNWVTSLTTPLYWRQENIRVDYTITNSSRLMVRYTQDSWTNKSPSNNDNLWGDDSFPAVDSNWDQPGRSFAASLNQTIGSHAVNTLQFSYSANKISVTRGGSSVDLNAQINQLMPSVFPSSAHEYAGNEGHPVFWGGSGYSTLWNEAPFHNNQDLFVFKDDYSLVFGDHLIKAGGLFSTNKKNEDVGGYGSYENSAFWGAGGLPAWGSTTGNVLADFLLKDMTWGFSEFSRQRQVPQRWKDLEFYVSDSWKVNPRVTLDYGLRYSAFMNPYAADDKIMSFDPAAFDPALGGDPCNGLRQAPDANWCQEAGFQGGTAADNRSLFPQHYNNFAPRVGIAWDINGDGKSALRAGVGQFYLRERLSPGLNVGANPPFVTNVSGVRTLDSNAEPCDGCFSTGNGAPNSGREQRGATSNNWQWNISYQREVLPHTTWDIGYVGNKGNDLLTTADINQVAPGDSDGNGVEDRLQYTKLPGQDGGPLRPYGVFGDHRITFWTHDGHSMYHSLQTQVVSRWGGSQLQVSYTLSRTRANTPLDNSSGNLAADETRLDLSNPDLDDGYANTDRRHVFNAALVLAGPTMEGQSGLRAALLGGWEVGAIVQAASGQAVTVYTGSLTAANDAGVTFNGGPSGTGYPDNQRPNMVSGVSCRADDSNNPDQILNPDAYTLVGFQLGSIGNEERGACHGPGLFQTDLAFYKTMHAGGRAQVQFRFEIFNVFNRANFLSQLLNTTMSPSNVRLNADGTAIESYTLGGNFGQATKVRDPRQMQFGLKIIF